MLPVSSELKEKLIKLNDSLKKNFPLREFDRFSVRERLEELGSFHVIKKWSPIDVEQWLLGRSVVGIDGSVNSTKGIPNKTISVFQALALGTRGEEKWAANIYTPLVEEENADEGAGGGLRKRSLLLSDIEMKLAQQVLQEWDAHVLFMDGSLLHFYVDHPEEWQRVADGALQRESYIVGVSEEIATSRIVKKLYPQHTAWSDGDLLYGILEVGEVFEWEDWSLPGSDLWRVAFRPSISPQPICVDGLWTQKRERFELLQLIYSLTPEQGRGIPFWLDIIDNQVRVTDSLVQTMVEQYIDPELRHRLFNPKRSERII